MTDRDKLDLGWVLLAVALIVVLWGGAALVLYFWGPSMLAMWLGGASVGGAMSDVRHKLRKTSEKPWQHCLQPVPGQGRFPP